MRTTKVRSAPARPDPPFAYLPPPLIGKGRDYAFPGAVDALKINAETFDFEPSA